MDSTNIKESSPSFWADFYSFVKEIFSHTLGGSSIRVCLVLIVVVSVYAVGMDVTTHRGLTQYSFYLALALVSFISGGYVTNKICDPTTMLPDSLKKFIKP